MRPPKKIYLVINAKDKVLFLSKKDAKKFMDDISISWGHKLLEGPFVYTLDFVWPKEVEK